MKLEEFLKRILDQLKSKPVQAEQQSSSARSQEVLANMLRKIELTQDIELTCGEAYAVLDQYAEMVVKGEDVTNIMPLIRQHLEICPDCREEFEALLRVLQNPPD